MLDTFTIPVSTNVGFSAIWVSTAGVIWVAGNSGAVMSRTP